MRRECHKTAAHRKKTCYEKNASMLPSVFLTASAGMASAAITPFTYTQTDKATGSGTISAFSITTGPFGVINFAARPMPAATGL